MLPDNSQTPQVQGVEPSGAATPAAPTTPAEPVAPATPSATPTDAEAQKVRLLEQQIAKYESDIRAVKSTSDKRFADAEKRWKSEQETLRKEVQAIRMASMDDTQRKQYEESLAAERQQQALQELEQTKMTAQEYQATLQALQYFASNGVPTDKLVLDQGYDALFNSGMGYMTEELKRLKTAPQQSSQAQPNLPNPPVVANGNQGVPSVKPTWTDLRNKYGSDEQIYRMVEAGLLPSDIIPG